MRLGEVRELLCRPWWTRTWILQEAIVAKKVLFIYGPETFGWDIVAAMVASFRVDMGLGDSYHTTHAPEESAMLVRFEAIDELRRTWSNTSGKRMRLPEILYNFRSQGCTNPRDRIYSFLGLAQMEGVLAVDVDYNLPLAEVYLRFARRMVDQTGSLDLLNCKREWRGVPPLGAQQVYAYHVYDQAKYHDINAKVHRDSYDEPKSGWALLPAGWEFVMNSDGTRYFLNHNTGQTQTESPLEGHPPPRARLPNEYRICPEGWVREYDNVGRPTISYQPSKAGVLLEAAATERARLAEQLGSLPSWVPNWSAPTQYDAHLIPSLQTAVEQDHLYRASGDLASRIAPSPPNILSVEGLLFDTVVQLSSAFHPAADIAHFYRKPQDPRVDWEAVALSPANEANPYGDRREAFLRLHVGDWVPEQPIPPTGDALENVKTWMEGDFRDGATLDELANMSIGEYLKKGFEVHYHSVKVPHGQYSKCTERIHRVTSHRALFVTEGGYMGLASWNAQVGDQVVVLKGGKTPFLVRPVGDEGRFELVGEAYVQGIMMGEALAMEKEMSFFEML
ncbi:heterokaryon incompatibility protein-domain-containing protein [Podospora conica]|nr:heterokaryon incompatibility protein-domain-containing protein [Schizothecium conicum]